MMLYKKIQHTIAAALAFTEESEKDPTKAWKSERREKCWKKAKRLLLEVRELELKALHCKCGELSEEKKYEVEQSN